MSVAKRPILAAIGAMMVFMARLGCYPAAAEPAAPVHLKVAGGLGSTSQYKEFEEPFWTKRLATASGSRVTAEVSPYDEMGLKGPDVLQLTRLGVISFGTVSLNYLASADAEVAAVDFAGMNPTIAALKANVDAYRGTLATLYRERYGVELLAIWTYPGQVIFCNRAVAGLRDLRGLKVRTASVMQNDFVEALGAVGVTIAYANISDALSKHVVDCAITGAISGYYLGLQRVATHLLDVTVNWGPNILVANHAAWVRLAPDVRALIERELAGLDEEVWAAAGRESVDGIVCMTGGTCQGGAPGHLKLVAMSAEDQTLLHQALTTVVMPRWAERCGRECVRAWVTAVGRRLGIAPAGEDVGELNP